MEKKRTSKTQLKIYIKYLRENRILVTGKLHPSSNPQDIEVIWLEIVQTLNSCGDGPIRDKAAWKKVFTEWKGLCRKKARDNKALSELEAELIEVTGSGAVTGLDMAELGSSLNTVPCVPNLPSTTLPLQTDDLEIPREIPKMKELPKTKPKRKGTGDLCDLYQTAVEENGDKLEAISRSIMEIAKAINRYCDIVEASGTVQYVEDVVVDNIEEDETTN